MPTPPKHPWIQMYEDWKAGKLEAPRDDRTIQQVFAAVSDAETKMEPVYRDAFLDLALGLGYPRGCRAGCCSFTEPDYDPDYFDDPEAK